ncbi:proto-oncogene tyrosine-protein kinase ROS-like isoform X3 [Myzus persicae]|uniref:proto-oncogene tyrosine-protein kinase ROS-like isoform X3 n=1 Tax=Myzus persicae TaxID=13164 RepID=UPI000B935C2B|nr:proto-oncogene tyrosine-protein kinase ROS-like isoform X3 [Myzus persicae]
MIMVDFYIYLVTLVFAIEISAQKDLQKDTIRLECNEKCHLQNGTTNHGGLLCNSECIVNQCIRGCALWNEALNSNCSKVCDKFSENYISQSKLYCIAGCNDAITLHFQRLQFEIGPLPSPTLVPDSLFDKSLKLQWKGVRRKNFKYRIQWKLENNQGNWQYCQKETWNNDSIIQLDNLRPYTNYQFRVVLLLTWSGVMQLVVSESSVVISTHPSKVPPSMTPEIEILTGKENETENFYMFRNLESAKNYSISLAARNEYGVGPTTNVFVKTLPTSMVKYTPEPVHLFLVSDHNIFVKTKEMMDTPISIYFTNQTINGMSINVRTNTMYILDSSGSLLALSNNKINILLTTEREILMDITIDWLNNYLYILMSSTTNKNTIVYSIKKIDLNQDKMEEIVSGFDSKPLQIEVDPCNGFLFWTTKFGLYRLDLSKKVKNLKTEILRIIYHKDIGPFVIDYINFCLMILFQKNNTIMSVSLDGQDLTDIRNNTITALFDDAITLSYVNGSFYWSNGSVLMGEDYFINEQKYYQNIYPAMHFSYKLILSNFTDQQPIPFPRNPPQSLQAISTSSKLKATWQVPHLLGGQGRSSWQGWSYLFSIKFENETNWKNIDTNKTEIVIDSLTARTSYVIRVAAYSSSGQGPWSSEFVVKTLNHNVSVLWGNAQQILISDIMGDFIESISINEDETSITNSSLDDVAWFEDCVFYVVNSSKINWLNLTSRQGSTLEDINSVQSIAIDWLGRKIYWADPSKQSILRENLFGGQRELLLASNIAKELKVESVGGYLYWSTGFAVKSSKLNGKEQHSYYSTDYFSGKKVMSLAVDSVGGWVYWILRENDKSKLFRAPTAEKLNYLNNLNPIKEFDNSCTQGPLFYVDHHLLWLQKGNDIMMSDTDGQYPAIIRAMNLNGIQTFSVRDQYAHPKPKGLETNVIPEEVDIKMIKVNPRYNESVYEIIWEPVKTVNHGLVSYTVKVLEKEDSKVDSLFETPNTKVLVDSTPLEISIKASTVWGSSQVVTIYSPIPTIPTDIRIFANFSNDNYTMNIILQHSIIQNVTNYEVKCYYQITNHWQMCSKQAIVSPNTQTKWTGLSVYSDLLFKIRACSMAGCSGWSQDIIFNQTYNYAVFKFKTALVSGSKIMIFHSNKQNYQLIILLTNSLVTSFTLNDMEDIAFWTDSKTIYSSPINKSINNKIYSISEVNIKIENLSFDWISKTLFWCEVAENQSKIMAFDIRVKTVKIVMTRSNKMFPSSAVLSEGLFIWIEQIPDSNEKHILKSNMSGTDVETFVYSSNNNCNCSDLYPFDNVLTSYISNSGKMRLLWVEGKHRNIIVSDINGCKCSIIFHVNSTFNLTSLAVDKHNIYWTTNQSMCSIRIKDLNDKPIIENNASLNCLNNITAVYTIDGLSESIKRPCPPGFPQVNQTLPSVYIVYWDPSESRVKSYSLERIIISEMRNRRSLNLNTTNWTTVYSGPQNHWFMSDVKRDLVFKFRVKAENHHGWWSDYRTSDEPFNPQYQVETLRNEDIPWKILLTGFILICLFLTMLIKYLGSNTSKGPMRPDVELGRLREMPQRPTFFHAINVGYQGAVLFQKKKKNELPSIKREQITLTKRLGSGAFGEVFEGKIKDIVRGESETRVAIKSLKEGASHCEVEEFLKEAKLMNNFNHKHILQLIGVCLDNDPNFIIMELMEEGDLLSYLRKNRQTNVLNLSDYGQMCIDVAEGCSYLEQMHFIHRDLACRNCLVSSSDPKERIIKIGDFGLARNIYTHDYYRKEGEALLPVRWMSPESLVDGVFTSQSDVWAFGVLLWEIMSVGQQPYPGLSNINVMYHVQHGGRLEKPINCPRTLYNLMQKCWHVDPEKRPRFEYCLKVLKSYMAMPLDYVNVSHDPQLHNVSLLSEKYTIDLITCIDSQQKLSPISNYDGYEIPIKIINNEYLELCNDKCEYLDLSSTPTVNMVDNRDSEPESISEDNLYCNMNPELIG